MDVVGLGTICRPHLNYYLRRPRRRQNMTCVRGRLFVSLSASYATSTLSLIHVLR
jgi:hypothetical protein